MGKVSKGQFFGNTNNLDNPHESPITEQSGQEAQKCKYAKKEIKNC